MQKALNNFTNEALHQNEFQIHLASFEPVHYQRLISAQYAHKTFDWLDPGSHGTIAPSSKIPSAQYGNDPGYARHLMLSWQSP
jgi:hypothetical protein